MSVHPLEVLVRTINVKLSIDTPYHLNKMSMDFHICIIRSHLKEG